MHFSEDPKVAYKDLVLCGFQSSTSQASSAANSKAGMRDAVIPYPFKSKHVISANPKRAFFNVLLVSATGAGKSQLMSHFIGQSTSQLDK